MPTYYQMTIRAEGELRDKDGNLISNVPMTSERVVSEEEAQAIAANLGFEDPGVIADDSRPLSSEPG